MGGFVFLGLEKILKNLFFRYGRDKKVIAQETLRISSIILLVAVLATTFPLFSLSIIIVAPMYTAMTYRNGIAYPLISLLMTMGALLVVPSELSMPFTFLTLATMGILVGEIYYRKKDMSMAIMIGTLVFVANIVLGIYAINQLSGTDFMEFMLNNYAQQLESGAVSSMLNVSSVQMKQTIRSIFPATIIFMGFFVGMLNYFMAGRIITRMSPEQQEFKTFGEFALPGSMLVAIGVTLVGLWAASALSGYSTELITNNLTWLYSFLFLVQGMSMVDYIFLRNRLPMSRTMMLTTMFFAVFLYPVWVTLGAVDAVFNLRRLAR